MTSQLVSPQLGPGHFVSQIPSPQAETPSPCVSHGPVSATTPQPGSLQPGLPPSGCQSPRVLSECDFSAGHLVVTLGPLRPRTTPHPSAAPQVSPSASLLPAAWPQATLTQGGGGLAGAERPRGGLDRSAPGSCRSECDELRLAAADERSQRPGQAGPVRAGGGAQGAAGGPVLTTGGRRPRVLRGPQDPRPTPRAQRPTQATWPPCSSQPLGGDPRRSRGP